MKKLNKKGMTSIEVLISFVVVAVISVSMYTTVSSYQNKEYIESCKEKIITYKNLLTKEINDDLIKKGLVSVDVLKYDPVKYEYKVILGFKNGSFKQLIIKNKGKDVMDLADIQNQMITNPDAGKEEFIISYGPYFFNNPSKTYEYLTEYPLPNLGTFDDDDGIINFDLKISSVSITTDNDIFSLFVGFSHSSVEERYYLNIVCPINF